MGGPFAFLCAVLFPEVPLSKPCQMVVLDPKNAKKTIQSDIVSLIKTQVFSFRDGASIAHAGF